MPTILIVDDEQPNLMAFEAVLTRDGYRVHTAAHPAQALQVLDRARPDLVLLDINLGSAGQTAGLDLLRLMRDRMPTIVVVMVSGYLDTPTDESDPPLPED
jgi:CheY-like chemotaxis protein